ncbi:MAG: 3-deoxy-manno-octulosonate cytidylyltransferase [Planctomycetota bacterium]
MSRIQVVLPARLESTRLPRKLLCRVGGKSVLQHTYEAACRATIADGVLVAVDDQELADEVDSFGGRWVMTPKDCASGTDRIAAVAEQLPDTPIFVNVQSDEPEINPAVIDAVAQAIVEDDSADVATAGTPIRTAAILADRSAVKIVMASRLGGKGDGTAIYFSRAAVPHDREGVSHERLAAEPPIYWHHLGLYAYRRGFLDWFARSPPGRLESIEKLEQLRAIEAGKKIIVTRVGPAQGGIDTRADLDAFRRRVEKPRG